MPSTSGVIVPNFTGRSVSSCAVFQISAYWSCPRPILPVQRGITRDSIASKMIVPLPAPYPGAGG